MTLCIDKRVRVVKTSSKPRRLPSNRFPWPRMSEADENGVVVPLGIDVEDKIQDIRRIVCKHFRIHGFPMEELMQEVYLAISHKNHTRSAHDPRKSSFSHYVYMISNNICRNIVNRKKRCERECESLDAPGGWDDSRTLFEVIDEATTEEPKNNHLLEKMHDIESKMRRDGKRDLARYIRAVRNGASQDVIREVLSWGDRKISNKSIRDFRIQIQESIGQFLRDSA